jgi:trans-aconitate 2-methyltransferase
MPDSKWDPAQYDLFRKERQQPFHDLLALVRVTPGMRVVDLGCGTGALTRELHRQLEARETVGFEQSETMLAGSQEHLTAGLSFRQERIEDFDAFGSFDLVFSNAALQWVDGHAELFARLWRALRPGGQLAVQMPANYDHPSHTIAGDLGQEEPYRTALRGYLRRSPVFPPERYAEILDRLGAVEQHVRLQVYAHHLDGPEDVVEWTKGTLLVAYRERLSEELFGDFLNAYRQRVLAALPQERPCFYPFKRILLWARRGEA